MVHKPGTQQVLSSADLASPAPSSVATQRPEAGTLELGVCFAYCAICKPSSACCNVNPLRAGSGESRMILLFVHALLRGHSCSWFLAQGRQGLGPQSLTGLLGVTLIHPHEGNLDQDVIRGSPIRRPGRVSAQPFWRRAAARREGPWRLSAPAASPRLPLLAHEFPGLPSHCRPECLLTRPEKTFITARRLPPPKECAPRAGGEAGHGWSRRLPIGQPGRVYSPARLASHTLTSLPAVAPGGGSEVAFAPAKASQECGARFPFRPPGAPEQRGREGTKGAGAPGPHHATGRGDPTQAARSLALAVPACMTCDRGPRSKSQAAPFPPRRGARSPHVQTTRQEKDPRAATRAPSRPKASPTGGHRRVAPRREVRLSAGRSECPTSGSRSAGPSPAWPPPGRRGSVFWLQRAGAVAPARLSHRSGLRATRPRRPGSPRGKGVRGPHAAPLPPSPAQGRGLPTMPSELQPSLPLSGRPRGAEEQCPPPAPPPPPSRGARAGGGAGRAAGRGGGALGGGRGRGAARTNQEQPGARRGAGSGSAGGARARGRLGPRGWSGRGGARRPDGRTAGRTGGRSREAGGQLEAVRTQRSPAAAATTPPVPAAARPPPAPHGVTGKRRRLIVHAAGRRSAGPGGHGAAPSPASRSRRRRPPRPAPPRGGALREALGAVATPAPAFSAPPPRAAAALSGAGGGGWCGSLRDWRGGAGAAGVGLPSPRPRRLLPPPPPPRSLLVTSERGIFQLVISAASTPGSGAQPGGVPAPPARSARAPRRSRPAAPGPPARRVCQESELREAARGVPRAPVGPRGALPPPKLGPGC
ncbi:collagen alpha-1(III) chain-like [Loxodonta africana]|uniref:collagen alpha-1(III) chain-like n=1 Tax=Loxodonta africana TaxID=9785 RepID=UPI0030CF4DE2